MQRSVTWQGLGMRLAAPVHVHVLSSHIECLQQTYFPCTMRGAHNSVCVVYPVISSTAGLKISESCAPVMFRSFPVLVTYPATPLLMGNLYVENS